MAYCLTRRSPNSRIMFKSFARSICIYIVIISSLCYRTIHKLLVPKSSSSSLSQTTSGNDIPAPPSEHVPIDETTSEEAAWEQGEKTIRARDEIWSGDEKLCTFNVTKGAPLPVVFLSMGRSGSSITWNTLSNLTGTPNTAYEATGSNVEDNIEFFYSINPHVGPKWASLKLCHIQQYVPAGSGIAGFQWKPYEATWSFHPYAGGAFHELAERGLAKIILLSRNPLMKIASNLRHLHSTKTTLKAHCEVGDEKCIKEHKELTKGMKFPFGTLLKRQVHHDHVKNNEIMERLEDAGLDYVHVTYEKLYKSSNADEWKKILRYLNVTEYDNLTLEDVRATFSIAETHSKEVTLKDMIENYDKVQNTLLGTEFEHLLHDY